MTIHAITAADILGTAGTNAPETPGAHEKPGPTPASASWASLPLLTATALVAAYVSLGSNAPIALGLSYATLAATGYFLIERAKSVAQNPGSVIYSANGFLAQPSSDQSQEDASIVLARDVSFAGALATGVAAVLLESWSFGALPTQPFEDQWNLGQSLLSRAVYGLLMVVVHMIMYSASILMVGHNRFMFPDPGRDPRTTIVTPCFRCFVLASRARCNLSGAIGWPGSRQDAPAKLSCIIKEFS